MGIYFIAAGSSSKNREKTLDKSYSVEEIRQYMLPKDTDYLKNCFPKREGVYLWGANDKNISDLSKLKAGEYVVDVKNKVVMQVFSYCFYIKTDNKRLQEFVGWDKEKPIAKRRPYQYVYFLKSPLPTTKKDKNYFQNAFDLNSNPQWLVGQKYFNDSEVLAALKRTSTTSLEGFLGIIPGHQLPAPQPTPLIPPERFIKSNPEPSIPINPPIFAVPDWLADLLGKVTALKKDTGHLERDHEDLVASLFELLGFERIHDIKFRRGNIDIRIDKNNKPIITIEVKADWSISPDSSGALAQAYNYAHQTATPIVIITNGDRYCVYDRRQGMSYGDNLIADFRITAMTKEDIDKLNLLRKDRINSL